MVERHAALVTLALFVTACSSDEGESQAGFEVSARAETSPSEGDPDDTAIWVHPGDASLSLIVATDKSGGIQLYELDGTLRQDLRDGVMNNVDLRSEVGGAWAGAAVIASSNRSDDTIDIYTIDASTRMLVRVAAFASDIGEPYGLCMSRMNDRLFVFIDDKDGMLAQYEIDVSVADQVGLTLRRTLDLGTQLEGCVADDPLGRLYVGEEDHGIWRLDASPDANDVPVLVHDVASGQLHADVEGLAIYPTADGGGYLIASSQGSSSYVVYERGGDNAYVTSFRIVAGTTDAAVESDGIEVTNVPLGPLWPDGLFIAHDDHNENFTRNFKLVGWGDIAAAADVELRVDAQP